MAIERYAPYSAVNLKVSTRSKVPGWRAELMRDGELVAKIEVSDEGDDVGCVFTTVRGRRAFDEHMASLPRDFFDMALADADSARALFVVEILDAQLEYGQLQAMCMERTCFRLKGDMDDAWRELDRPYSETLARRLRRQFGAALHVIANERFLPDSWSAEVRHGA